MSEEEKFDELLSSKLSEREFPFNELSWDEAERLIDRQEKRKKATRFALIFVAGIVAGVLIMLPFMPGTHGPLPELIAVHPPVGQNTVVQNSPLPNARQPAAGADNTIQKEQKTAAASPKGISRGDTFGHSDMPAGDNRAGLPSAFVKKNTPKGIRATPANISAIPEHKHHAPTLPPVAKNRSAPAPVKSNTLASVAPPVSAIKDNNESGKVSKAINPSSSQTDNPSIAKNNPSEPVANSKIRQKDTSNNETANNNLKPDSPDTSIKSTATNPTAVNNTSVAKTSNNPTRYPDTSLSSRDDLLSSPMFPNIFSVYAGGTYSYGWLFVGPAKEIRQARGITPWGGFNFTHYFTGHISASLGIGYAELSGLNSTYNSSVVEYGFGTNQNVTSVTPQIVYYMAFPFKIQYDIDSKDLLGIGCNYLLMMTTYSTLTTYQQTDFASTSGTSKKQNGYTQGFFNSDWQLTFSYSRMLLNRLGISVEYYRDLGYVENNTIPNLTQSGKNSGFRLVFSYQILK